jgi:hypothetical protein
MLATSPKSRAGSLARSMSNPTCGGNVLTAETTGFTAWFNENARINRCQSFFKLSRVLNPSGYGKHSTPKRMRMSCTIAERRHLSQYGCRPKVHEAVLKLQTPVSDNLEINKEYKNSNETWSPDPGRVSRHYLFLFIAGGLFKSG